MRFMYLAQNGRVVNLFRDGLPGTECQGFRGPVRKRGQRREGPEGFAMFFEGMGKAGIALELQADRRWTAGFAARPFRWCGFGEVKLAVQRRGFLVPGSFIGPPVNGISPSATADGLSAPWAGSW
jgi:hypothetical protein